MISLPNRIGGTFDAISPLLGGVRWKTWYLGLSTSTGDSILQIFKIKISLLTYSFYSSKSRPSNKNCKKTIGKTQNLFQFFAPNFSSYSAYTFFGTIKNFAPLEKVFHSLSFEILQFFYSWLDKNCKFRKI